MQPPLLPWSFIWMNGENKERLNWTADQGIKISYFLFSHPLKFTVLCKDCPAATNSSNFVRSLKIQYNGIVSVAFCFVYENFQDYSVVYGSFLKKIFLYSGNLFYKMTRQMLCSLGVPSLLWKDVRAVWKLWWEPRGWFSYTFWHGGIRSGRLWKLLEAQCRLPGLVKTRQWPLQPQSSFRYWTLFKINMYSKWWTSIYKKRENKEKNLMLLTLPPGWL